MQKKLWILLGMLLISTILVTCVGAYLRDFVLAPVGLFQEKSLLEVPFVVLKDPAARFALENLQSEEVELPTQAPTEPPEIPRITVKREILPEFSPLGAMRVPKAPPFQEITESWFDDALFIGDSRTVGLRDYARLGNADYFCSIGMTVFDAKELWLSDVNFEESNLEWLLRTKRYNKIYISLGLNECNYPYDLLMEGYESLIDLVRSLQPDAVIILHGMITVSRKKAASEWYFALENLSKINAGIQKLADGHSILYIDANGHFADEEGYLPSDLTADGCHFYISGYQDWANWILENAGTLNISFG